MRAGGEQRGAKLLPCSAHPGRPRSLAASARAKRRFDRRRIRIRSSHSLAAGGRATRRAGGRRQVPLPAHPSTRCAPLPFAQLSSAQLSQRPVAARVRSMHAIWHSLGSRNVLYVASIVSCPLSSLLRCVTRDKADRGVGRGGWRSKRASPFLPSAGCRCSRPAWRVGAGTEAGAVIDEAPDQNV